jgi:hypothetical protein
VRQAHTALSYGTGDVELCSLSEVPRRFVLGVSTGHVASQTLSDPTCFRTPLGKPIDMTWNFEEGHIYDDVNRLLTPFGLKGW